MDRLKRLGRRPAFQLFVLALAVALTYGHTLDVPFYLDDHLSIEKNPALRTLDPAALWHDSPRRIVGYYTLALNYRFGGSDPAGYHLVNLLIHLAATWLVWGLARALLDTPALRDRCPKGARWALPLTAALIFALHPLQIQAVTYVVQRLASLTALWYLAALLGYVKLRLATGPVRWGWVGLCAAATLLALFTKENAFTLPLAWWLLELAFLSRGRFWVWMTGATMLAGALGLLWATSHLEVGWLRRLDALTRETRWFGRGDYLAAQMKALWWYLRLFFWPAGLRLDYGFHRPPAWSDPGVIAAAAGHLAVLAAALRCVGRRPLPAFGVLFYYAAHVVESSVIPIKDLVFELELPRFGGQFNIWGLNPALVPGMLSLEIDR